MADNPWSTMPQESWPDLYGFKVLETADGPVSYRLIDLLRESHTLGYVLKRTDQDQFELTDAQGVQVMAGPAYKVRLWLDRRSPSETV